MISKRTILEMYQLREQGFAVRSIARQLQINRETVAKYLAGANKGKNKHTPRGSKLDRYKGMIDTLIKECPDFLRAQPHGISYMNHGICP